MYIIAGGGISIAGSGAIDSVSGGGTPAPVMIFNTDSPTCATGGPCQADITFSTNSSIDLLPIATGPYRGILIWNDGGVRTPGTNVELLGGTNLNIRQDVQALLDNVLGPELRRINVPLRAVTHGDASGSPNKAARPDSVRPVE